MLTDAVDLPAQRVASILRERGETVAVAEGSAGGLISAALLAIPGASAYFLGGAVVYTARANRAWMAGAVEPPDGMRGATEEFADYLARSAALKLGADWGIGEAGAAGPANPYGDPAGHCWIAVASGDDVTTKHLLTGIDDRPANMVSFAAGALELFASLLESRRLTRVASTPQRRSCHAVAMLDHLGIQCADMAKSAAFYDAVLAPLGATRLMDFGVALGYGIAPDPDFWIGVFDSGDGFRESHIAFAAADRATVHAFFDAAVAAGAEVLHEPRLWPEYHEHYYGAFVRDPDGNNVEAVCHQPE